MTIGFQTLPCTDSCVSRLDPRWKLAALVPLLVAVTLVQRLPATLLLLAVALSLALLARLPRRWYLPQLGAALGFVVLFAAPLPFLLQGPDGPDWLWTWGPLHFSEHGAVLALRLCCKVATVSTLALVILGTAPLDATLKAMHALKTPGLLVQLLLLTYRYVFVLTDELSRLRLAVRVRGYRNRVSGHSYRTIGHVAGTLLVRGYERSERVGQAMRCRGFDGRFRSLTTFHTTAADVLTFLVVLSGCVVVCLWDQLP
jgi:cobalt/nickel transport system permease protein